MGKGDRLDGLVATPRVIIPHRIQHRPRQIQRLAYPSGYMYR